MSLDFQTASKSEIARFVLDHPYLDWDPEVAGLPRITDSFGRQDTRFHTYDVLADCGQGGSGVVYKVRRDNLVKAIKTLRFHWDLNCDYDEAATISRRIEPDEIDQIVCSVEAGDSDANTRFRRELIRRRNQCALVARQLQPFQEARDKFIRECETLRRINHPQIVHVEAVFNLPLNQASPLFQLPFLVMEYVNGVSLHNWLMRQQWGGFPESLLHSTTSMWMQIAEAVSVIHDVHSLHRDLSYNNIMIRSDNGSVVIIDLGNTINPEIHETVGVYLNGQVIRTPVHTPGFAPLDQLQGNLTDKVDQYALGVNFFYWVTREFPWKMADGNLPSRLDDFSRVVQGRPLIEQLNRRLSAAGHSPLSGDAEKIAHCWWKVINRMIKPLPGERFSSVREALAHLEVSLDEIKPASERELFELTDDEVDAGGSISELRQGIEQDSVQLRCYVGCSLLNMLIRQMKFQFDDFRRRAGKHLGTLPFALSTAAKRQLEVTEFYKGMREAVLGLYGEIGLISKAVHDGGLFGMKFGDLCDSTNKALKEPIRSLRELEKLLLSIDSTAEISLSQEVNHLELIGGLEYLIDQENPLVAKVEKLRTDVGLFIRKLAKVEHDLYVYAVQLQSKQGIIRTKLNQLRTSPLASKPDDT